MVDEQANGAAEEDLEGLAQEGIPFYGTHGSGCEYGPGLFASDGKKYVSQECLYSQESPAVSALDALGAIDRRDLKGAKTYWKVLLRAKRALRKLAANWKKNKD